MEKQYKLTDRVSKDALKSPTFKKWSKRVLCLVCILSLALQLTLCCLPMQASAAEDDSILGTWVWYDIINFVSSLSSIRSNTELVCNGTTYDGVQINANIGRIWYFIGDVSTLVYDVYTGIGWLLDIYKTITINDYDESYSNNLQFALELQANATKRVSTVYDFSGEYRLLNEQLSNLSFAQSGTVTQSYAFDFNIWGGYNADYFIVQADGSSVDISYSFTDDGSGGIKTVYRQLLRDGKIVGTWLVPRARLIYFQSNPEDPTFQQWLLDNTTLIDEAMIESVYGFGYDNGYNDGWTNSAIGDTLKAPVEALNSIILLDIAGTSITLGGVIFTMVVLSLMLIFLKKYAGG